MEQIKKFLRDKGFALALAACVLAAAIAGIWAVRAIRGELEKEWQSLSEPDSTAGVDEGLNETEDANEWEQQTTQAANSLANVPRTEQPARSGSQAASSRASGASSGSSGVSEPRELQTGSAPASSSAARASTQPALGHILNAYSGDELVYNKTMGDWRTHNGTDYACEQGETVASPVAGTVVEAGKADGNWGEVIAIKDGKGRVWRLCGITGQKVKKGATVTVGQPLGKAGEIAAECAEDSHIHIEVTQGDEYLDPARLIK